MAQMLGCEFLAQPGAEEVAQMTRDVFPAFDPGPHLAVRLADRRFHPLDTHLDDLVDGPTARGPLRVLLPLGLGDILAVPDPGFHGIDLSAGHGRP